MKRLTRPRVPDSQTQKPTPNCASGNQSRPRVLHCLHCRGSGGNLGDHPRHDRRASGWQLSGPYRCSRNREIHIYKVQSTDTVVCVSGSRDCLYENMVASHVLENGGIRLPVRCTLHPDAEYDFISSGLICPDAKNIPGNPNCSVLGTLHDLCLQLEVDDDDLLLFLQKQNLA